MPKFEGWLVKKEYFKVEVEAKDWSEAREKIWDADLDDSVDTLWEIYDVEEIQNA
jgi:hypothetical protein